MKVLYHTLGDGQSWWRVTQPAHWVSESLGQMGVDLTVSKQATLDYDCIILQRAPTAEFMPILKQYKKFIWMIDDDIWNLPITNPAYKVYTPEIIERCNWCRDNAAWIIVSTYHLASLINQSNVLVLPNLIDLDMWNHERVEHHDVRIIWAGSAYHVEDLEMLVPIFDEIAKLDVTLIFFGDMPEGMVEWARIPGQPYAAMVPHARYNGKVGFVNPVPIEHFPRSLCALAPDIGLAPLTSHPFNNSKSNIKYCEYSMAGAVTIASEMPPYKHTLSVFGDWWEAVRAMIDEVEERKFLAAMAKDQVVKHFSWQHNKEVWIKSFAQMLR